MKHILDAILAGDTSAEDFAALELPESLPRRHRPQGRGRHVRGARQQGEGPAQVAPRRGRRRCPSSARARRYVAVMASAINYNTVWTSIFEPVSTFGFLERYGRTSPLGQAPRPALPRRRLRPRRRRAQDRRSACTPGSPATRSSRTACRSSWRAPTGHNDTMLDPEQRIWGFETNFGGLADIALVKSNQLMPKPAHLTWEEAASPGLVNSTAYRQLVSRNGAGMKQGDNVLIWGASGGLGGFATQYALNGGATPVCVVSNDEKAEICRSDGRRADHQPLRGGLPVLEGRAHPGPEGVAALRRADPRAHRRRGRRHRLRAPRSRDLRRLGLRRAQGRHDRHLRLDQRATCTSTTTATCG